MELGDLLFQRGNKIYFKEREYQDIDVVFTVGQSNDSRRLKYIYAHQTCELYKIYRHVDADDLTYLTAQRLRFAKSITFLVPYVDVDTFKKISESIHFPDPDDETWSFFISEQYMTVTIYQRGSAHSFFKDDQTPQPIFPELFGIETIQEKCWVKNSFMCWKQRILEQNTVLSSLRGSLFHF